MTKQPSWCVGIDWATAAHQVCVIDADGNELGNRSFPHSGSGLAAMADWILERTGPDPANVPVAIEVPHGPVTRVPAGTRLQYALDQPQAARSLS